MVSVLKDPRSRKALAAPASAAAVSFSIQALCEKKGFPSSAWRDETFLVGAVEQLQR